MTNLDSAPVDSAASQFIRLQTAQELTARLGGILALEQLLTELPRTIAELLPCDRCYILVTDDDHVTLRLRGSFPAIEPRSLNALAESTVFSIFNKAEADGIKAWLAGHAYHGTRADLAPDLPFFPFLERAGIDRFLSAPLLRDGALIGLIVAQNTNPDHEWDADTVGLLEACAPNAAIILKNALTHTKTVDELADKVFQLNILNQIDRELNDTINLSHVFDMTLDWAMRYTNSQAASLALYDEATDTIRVVSDLGYNVPPEQLAMMRAAYGGGIAKRVARSGRAEVVPDVTLDQDYILISNNIRSHMSVPVMREDRVIAVISVETKRLNGHTEEHLQFVEKLAARAGVAIDNARLFAESVREREKLSLILRDIVDVVIVVDKNDRLILVNQSAVAACRLYRDRVQVGRPFAEVFEDTELIEAFPQAKETRGTMVREVVLPNRRTYYANFSPHPDIGWIIVMHDITPLKETEQLKNELLSTVSHDLKQPLAIMQGYIELLQMRFPMPDEASSYLNVVLRSLHSMRGLIDDLLDFAKIESGLQLNLVPVDINKLIAHCVEAIKPAAQAKAMTITNDLPAPLPPVLGDAGRLMQIFNNLISNAVKYTPPEGHVRIYAEQRENTLLIAIKDDGLGISPEDQARVFDRFYRVRRSETESIEGTGLGLAIVKKLIEAHRGRIGLVSALGEGSTFTVTLPLAPQE